MQEIKIDSYYQSLRDKDFIDTNFMCKLGMEFFLSILLFKGDVSRVIYSKEDIAFRRRIEMLGNGDVENSKLNYVNLNLPYAIYSQTSGIEEDDRGATQNASQIVKGVVDPNTGIVVKGAAVKTSYSSTVFFSSRADVNIATQLLYWDKTPHAPLYFIVENDICGSKVDIPVFITLDEIDSDVEYNEKDWLKNSKIFPMKLKFTIRSYQTLIEDIDGFIKLPLRFSKIYAYNDEKVVFTQKTSLIWSNAKFNSHNHIISIDDENKLSKGVEDEKAEEEKEEDGSVKSICIPKLKFNVDGTADLGDVNLANSGKTEQVKLDNTVADVIEGYFEEDTSCKFLEFHQVDDETTENEVTIEWKLEPNDELYFKSLTIFIPGLYNTNIDTAKTTKFKFENLHPGSEYNCSLILYANNSTKSTYLLNLKTKGEKVLGNKLSDLLVGRTFATK